MDGGEKSTELERSSSKPSAVYPFLKGQFGIPLNEISTPFVGEVKTGSGRTVICEFAQRGERSWIRVEDLKDHFVMHAVVEKETASAEIHTRKKDGKRHPDFFAKHFLAFALNHFKNEGHPVRKFNAMWSPVEGDQWASDNYEDYWKFRKEGIPQAEAVRKTWTGRVLAQLGFTEIEDIKGEEGSATYVTFKKPDAALTNKS